MQTCIRAYVHICICAHEHTCIPASMHTCIQTYVRTYRRTDRQTDRHTFYICAPMYIHVGGCAHMSTVLFPGAPKKPARFGAQQRHWSGGATGHPAISIG